MFNENYNLNFIMSIKGVLKKKFNIKNPIISMKRKKDKIKTIITETSVDTYHKLDIDGIKSTTTETPLKLGNVGLCTNIDTNETRESMKIKKKRKSIDTNNEVDPTKKKKVTFADNVVSRDKSTAGKMKKLSLNKKKKKDYISKLKAKKKKLKNAKICERIAFANGMSRQERACEYLIQWKNDRCNWKFKKINQLWLIKNTYDLTLISKENFEILVEYLQTIEGKSRNLILECANNIIAEFSASNYEEQELNLSQTNKYQRARTIIQMLS